MRTLSVDLETLARLSKEVPLQILRGLPVQCIGLLLSPPGIGKSNLCISIAYSIATGVDSTGLLVEKLPKKVSYWGAEDGVNQVSIKLFSHLSLMNDKSRELIRDNMQLIDNKEPIVCSMNAGADAKARAEDSLNKLIAKLREHGSELLIIDTLREVAGTADETKDDIAIRMALTRITDEANCAVLAVHHPTKVIARGEQVNSVSQSGLSTTGAKSRVNYYIHPSEGPDNRLTLSFPKANLLMPGEKKPIQLLWTPESMLYSDRRSLNHLMADKSSESVVDSPASPEIKEPKKKAVKPKKVRRQKKGALASVPDENPVVRIKHLGEAPKIETPSELKGLAHLATRIKKHA